MLPFFNPYGLKACCVLLAFMICCDCFAQEDILKRRLSFECTGCTFDETLNQIEHKINYYFSYNTGPFVNKNNISLNLQNQPLFTILDTLIQDTTIHYKVVEDHIILYRFSQTRDTTGILSENLPYRLIVISGKILDQRTSSAIPFANVTIVGKSIGSVSNLQGEFVIKVPLSLSADTIGISCIGYKTFFLPVNEAVNRHTYTLEIEYVPIQEVIIRNTDPVYLLRSALNKIPENYPAKPSLLTSFYRETIKKGNNYIGITEAVLQTYKSGYGTENSNDQIKIEKGRKIQYINPRDTVSLKLKAGLNATLLLDIVKNPTDFLQKDFFQYYDYKLSDIIVDNDQEAYVIDFKQKESVKEPLYFGRIYIDIHNLALTNFEFSLNPEGIEKTWDRFVVKKPSWLKVRPSMAKYYVNYRKFGGYYYLNTIRLETEFKIRTRRQLFGWTYDSKIEMVVIDIDTSGVKKFRYREIANAESILTEEFHESSESYWIDYNYIKPDEPLEEAIKKIISHTGDNKFPRH